MGRESVCFELLVAVLQQPKIERQRPRDVSPLTFAPSHLAGSKEGLLGEKVLDQYLFVSTRGKSVMAWPKRPSSCGHRAFERFWLSNRAKNEMMLGSLYLVLLHHNVTDSVSSSCAQTFTIFELIRIGEDRESNFAP